MSTRPLNPIATIVTFDGSSWVPVKDLHIDIQFAGQDDRADAGRFAWPIMLQDNRLVRIVDTTAQVLPLQEEESK